MRGVSLGLVGLMLAAVCGVAEAQVAGKGTAAERVAGSRPGLRRTAVENLVKNGDLRNGQLVADKPEAGMPDNWTKFTLEPGVIHQYVLDEQLKYKRLLRVIGGGQAGKPADGGFVQRVEELDGKSTYLVSAWVRSAGRVDEHHQCFVGIDPTGQQDDAKAATIVWTPVPVVSGKFLRYESEPIRPAGAAISIWLRARTIGAAGSPGTAKVELLKVDFDDIGLHRIESSPALDPLAGDPEGQPLKVDKARLAALNARVDELMKELPKRAVMSGKGMRTKLGLYYFLGYAESKGFFELADTGCVPIVRVIGQAADRARYVVQRNPKAIVVIGTSPMAGEYRLDPGKQTPKEAAEHTYKVTAGNLNHVPKDFRSRVDFIECAPCMWEPGDPQAALWYSEFLCELLPRLADLGPRPVVLNTGIGGLPIKPDVLAGMVPGLRLAHHLGGDWGSHGYTQKYCMDEKVESYYSLRYRRPYKFFKTYCPEMMDFSVLSPEAGVDEIGDQLKSGWQARGSIEKQAEWLAWYDEQLKRDDQMLGVTLFKIGTPAEWKSFDLEPLTPWLRGYYQSQKSRK